MPDIANHELQTRLPLGTVQIWKADLSAANGDWERKIPELSEEEQAKAVRYKAPDLQRRFTASRWLLRRLAAFYTGTDAACLTWAYSEHGKPNLSGSQLRFNLSHTADSWIGAFAWNMELGVDVERVRPMPNAAQLVSRFFSSRERAEFDHTPEEERLDALFRGWTRKEAFIKAIGRGLSFPLDRFSVPLGNTLPHSIQDLADPELEGRDWHLASLSMPTGWHAALVTEGVPERLEIRDWTPETETWLLSENSARRF